MLARTRLRRHVAGFALAVLSLAACGETSRVDPDATVRVSGVVRNSDGSPLADRPVRLGSGVSEWEGGAAVLTVGLFCLTGVCSGDFFDTTTTAEGRYTFDLVGEDTRSTFGEAESFQLSTSAAPRDGRPGGPAIAARFRIQTTDVRMPELRLVDPAPVISVDGPAALVRWDAAVVGGPVSVEVEDVERVAVWASPGDGGELRLDGRLLEDAAGVVGVAGTRNDAIEGSPVEIRWRSSTAAFRGGLGPPPSRGADCELVAATGRTEALRDCGVTDGSFAPAVMPTSICPQQGTQQQAPCQDATVLRVLLPAPVPAELVVVRGCSSGCRVRVVRESSPDIVDVGPVSDGFGTVALDRSPVTAVEVATGDVSALAEVSVWPPVPPGGEALRPVDEALEGSSLAEGSGTGDAGPSWWLVVAAGILLFAATLGTGVALGRRGRG